jgi:hypothetical protein
MTISSLDKTDQHWHYTTKSVGNTFGKGQPLQMWVSKRNSKLPLSVFPPLSLLPCPQSIHPEPTGIGRVLCVKHENR